MINSRTVRRRIKEEVVGVMHKSWQKGWLYDRFLPTQSQSSAHAALVTPTKRAPQTAAVQELVGLSRLLRQFAAPVPPRARAPMRLSQGGGFASARGPLHHPTAILIG
jgi:hypothetical protein